MRILFHVVSIPIGNSWCLKLCVNCFWHPFFHLNFLFAISGCRSYFQESSCVPVHSTLLCTIFTYHPIGIWCICFIDHHCRFIGHFACVSPKLVYLRVAPDTSSLACFLVSWWTPGMFCHFLCTQCTGQLWDVFLPGSALCHQLQRWCNAPCLGCNPVLEQTWNPWLLLLSSFVHQLLGNTYHALSKSIRSWVIWAACLVHDAVTL